VGCGAAGEDEQQHIGFAGRNVGGQAVAGPAGEQEWRVRLPRCTLQRPKVAVQDRAAGVREGRAATCGDEAQRHVDAGVPDVGLEQDGWPADVADSEEGDAGLLPRRERPGPAPAACTARAVVWPVKPDKERDRLAAWRCRSGRRFNGEAEGSRGLGGVQVQERVVLEDQGATPELVRRQRRRCPAWRPGSVRRGHCQATRLCRLLLLPLVHVPSPRPHSSR
jgi:hypothetical protein